MFWLDIAYKILKVFKDGATPSQIAWGLTLGWLMGLMPGWPLQVFGFLLIALFFNVNLTMVVLGTLAASFVSWVLDPVLDSLGYWILTDIGQFKELFTVMFNSPLWMLTRFNNTVVMGGFAIGIISALPLFFILRTLVIQFRKNLLDKLVETRLGKLFKRSWIYGIYSKINAVGSRI